MSISTPECVLLTGATGYIGSHTWLALLEAGYEVIGVDIDPGRETRHRFEEVVARGERDRSVTRLEVDGTTGHRVGSPRGEPVCARGPRPDL